MIFYKIRWIVVLIVPGLNKYIQSVYTKVIHVALDVNVKIYLSVPVKPIA